LTRSLSFFEGKKSLHGWNRHLKTKRIAPNGGGLGVKKGSFCRTTESKRGNLPGPSKSNEAHEDCGDKRLARTGDLERRSDLRKRGRKV